jgi:hypothetical protein
MMDNDRDVAIGDFDVAATTTTTFLDGSRRRVIRIGPTWVGEGEYQPGWQWSRHVYPMHGKASERHAGYVVSGQMAVRGCDGSQVTVVAGGAFYAAPGHDAWVVGDQPCVALDFPLA